MESGHVGKRMVDPLSNMQPVPVIQRLERSTGTSAFLDRLAEIMNDEKVKLFFKDYFGTWSDAKAALMLLQTYIAIDEAYCFQTNGQQLSSTQITAMVREMICDKECRKFLVEAMARYTAENGAKFLQAYRQVNPEFLPAVEWHNASREKT